jgi:hypothetical protein
MTKLLTIVGLLTVFATPVLAATTVHHHHHWTSCRVAQAPSSGYGTGNSLPFTFDQSGHAHQVLTPTPNK